VTATATPPPTTSRGDEPLLSVRDLRVTFTRRGETPFKAVDGVSFDVRPGQTVGLVGESGCGKSVTSLAIMGLLPKRGNVVEGEASFEGVNLLTLDEKAKRERRGRDIAMIFQQASRSLNPAYTVGDQIAETVRRHRNVSRRDATDRAVEVMDLVGIPNARTRVRSYPHEFSGGMRQRVMIAMALACEPTLLIADEPTTALDVTIQAQILDLLREIQERLGMAILFITHDLGVVADICDDVLVMYAGQIVERSGIFDLYAQPRHPYTEGLLVSMPQVGSQGEELHAIPGSTPAPWALPPGCRFHPRCDHARPPCTEGPVPLLDVGAGRTARCVRVDELELRGTR
jgi:peptide/nickel transport system ATP-binding protein